MKIKFPRISLPEKVRGFIPPLDRVPWSVVTNILLVYLCYFICRAAFVLENLNIFGDSLYGGLLWRMFVGGLHFDTSAICYTNSLYLLMVLLPLHFKEKGWWEKTAKWLFIVVNEICVIMNLCDCVYYQYTFRRTTSAVFEEFGGNTNLGAVFGAEFVNHWYFVLLAVLLFFVLWKGYRPTLGTVAGESRKRYYAKRTFWLLFIGFFTWCGMRGYTPFTSSRPIAMANAHQYVDNPIQAAIVLNTPFTFLRTSASRQAKVPRFYENDDEVAQYYTAVHVPDSAAVPNNKNIVVIIVESFAEEFVGARNRDLDGGTYRGYTEFTDSLLEHSLTFEHTYCNTNVSIDAMPAVLSSLPKMYTSFILSPYSLDDVPGIAKELKDYGYTSAFFHGAENSSMGFQAFARSAGFDDYYGRDEYDADPRFNGEADFDGTWGIWDEEFLQFFCLKMSEMQQPFYASVFTLSSHHPFKVPDRYRDRFTDEGQYPLHKCIRYTDNALRRFFDTARTQPWFENTVFVITADHASSKVTHAEYKTSLGFFRVPIIIYDPSGTLPRGTKPGIAQQIDIMPTLLAAVGYDREFVSFGKNLLETPGDETWAMNFHEIPQYIKGDYLIQLDVPDYNLRGVYRFKTDKLMQQNLLESGDYDRGAVQRMEAELKAMLQEIDTRMKDNNLRINR